jgi:hypothetical protein
MSRKMLKVLILGAMVVSAFASAASSASATRWTSSATGTWSATAPASVLTLSGGSGIYCSTTSATATVSALSGLLTAPVASVSLFFKSCSAADNPVTVTCTGGGVRLFADSETPANTVNGHFTSTGASLCTIRAAVIPGCTIIVSPTAGAGATIARGKYVNPGTHGVLTVFAAGQALTATISGCGTVFGSAATQTATFSGPSGADLPYTIVGGTSTTGPTIHVVP